MEFMVDRSPVFMGARVNVRIVVPLSARNSPCYVDLPTMIPLDEGMEVPPALKLTDAEAQQLCDGLYAAGVRPTNGAGSVGQLAATQAHLEDIKKVAFHALKIQ